RRDRRRPQPGVRDDAGQVDLAAGRRRPRGARRSLLQPVRPLLDARLRLPPRPRARHGAPVIHGRLPWPLVFQVLGVLLAIAFVVATWQVWMLLFTALIIAAAILPAARSGERYRVPRGVTVL